MASRRVLVLAIAAAFLPALTSAVDYNVGDDAGWTLKYPANWADSKTFNVGDNLVFKYPKGNHTVIEVDWQAFKDCNLQGNRVSSWYSGEDIVMLDKPGKRWFFCDKPYHCRQGMKLVVNVAGGNAGPSTSPSSTSSSSATLNYKIGGLLVQAMVVVVAAMSMI